MPIVSDRGPPQKAAMFLSHAQAEGGLLLRGWAMLVAWPDNFPASKAPAHGLPCGAGLYGTSSAR
jgi:hypothetical protein